MSKKTSVILLVTVVLVAIVIAAASAVGVALADENNVVVWVHFYNGSGEYDYDHWGDFDNVTWGSYYWIDTGRIVARYGDDEQFHKDNDTANVGKLFRISLTTGESRAVTSGKKLGLIMVRAYIDELNYLTPYWRNNTGKDLSSDRYLEIKKDKLNQNNEYHVWIIAGDKNNYTSIEEAKSAFERIESANFDDFDTLLLQTTKPIDKDTAIDIYKVTDAVGNPDGELFRQGLHASEFENGGLNSKITKLGLSDEFDWHADYRISIPSVAKFTTSATKTRLLLSQKFKNECLATDAELGALYTAESTTFRVWAPLSTNVIVNFYRTGNELDLALARSALPMDKKSNGLWELNVPGDLAGVYYTYTNYADGAVNETADIYATAVGVNGNRSMVCDLSATNPDKWSEDLQKATTIRNNSDTAVIWEVHVRDFSISPDSGLTYKGKYLAFTEQDTTVKGTDMASGIAYLQQLGVTYVHLNPVFDFSTVDEEYINNTDYTTKQNWGYDPKNYNVPEGSYATNAEDGAVRIAEFKQMVQALHNAGIGVIMDVVYNHTYTADSWFDKTVPGYYYRQALSDKAGTFDSLAWTTNALGVYNLSDGSGCSNETASERAMYRKYMVDSLVYWATEYHVDGFRFDLMAIHDVTTMNAIRDALDGIEAGGSGILLYGEPWAAGALGLDTAATGEKSANSDNLNELRLHIAAFNDRMREGIKGNNDGGTGYVQGNVDGNLNRIKAGINGLFLNYSGEGVISDCSQHAVTYTTSHDNYTLWDQLINTTVVDKSPTIYSERNAVLERKNMLAATLTLTSKGTAFILAGEEMARTKYGNHNSYNAQDKINAIDYKRQKQFERLYDWYQSLIELRTKRFTSIAKGNNQAQTTDFYGCLVYTFYREVGTDEYSKVTVMLNPYVYNMDMSFDQVKDIDLSGSWTVIADQDGFDFNSTKTVSGGLSLPAYSAYILVQE